VSLFPFNRYTAPLDAVAETQEQYLELPQTVEVTTGTGVPASVVWLHGLGADGHDFEPIVPQLELPAGTEWRFVFPHAPVRPVTLNGGMRMRAWFDIYSTVERSGVASSAIH
jgi:phospholipase/carboxylesterase